jgi:hypothetical protein
MVQIWRSSCGFVTQRIALCCPAPLYVTLLDVVPVWCGRPCGPQPTAGGPDPPGTLSRLWTPSSDDDPARPGTWLRHANWYVTHFKPAVRKANLPAKLRFHDLRHTCASLLIAQGAHPKAIATVLGHSTIQLTMDRPVPGRAGPPRRRTGHHLPRRAGTCSDRTTR